MKKQPFIIIFDIDNTIIGDLGMLNKEYYLLEYIYNICKKKGINTKCLSFEHFDMQEELKNGLLRPFAADFINYCNKKFKNAEVFFYTNSSYKWTNGALGENIEKALKIKVNRPFFTREDSMSLYRKKSLANIYPTIITSLLKRYPSLNDEKIAEHIFNNRTIFIDDIMDNIFAYTNRQLVCPAYEYMPYYDVYEKCITKYKMDPLIFNDKDILQYMANNDIHIYNKNGNIYQKNKEYIAIANLYNLKRYEINKKENNDTYYKELIAELSKKSVSTKCLTDKNIKAINKKIKIPIKDSE
jgi:hypothetical protein